MGTEVTTWFRLRPKNGGMTFPASPSPATAAAALWTWLLSAGLFIVAATIDGGFGGAREKAVSLEMLALGLALFIAVVVAFRDIRRLEALKYTSGAIAVLLLLATIAVGTSVNGARLWLRVGGLQIQPGEFAKILLVVFLAGYWLFDRLRDSFAEVV